MKKNNVFWVSYSDLMTSLFFIMLVLFIIALGFVQIRDKQIEDNEEYSDKTRQELIAKIDELNKIIGEYKAKMYATQQQLKKIQELQTSAHKLDPDFFTYQPEFKRFKLNRKIRFERGMHEIKNSDKPYLLEVGKKLNEIIQELKEDEKYKEMDLKYLVIIEGMASADKYEKNFELSYQRAHSLYDLWHKKYKNEALFDSIFCEIQIAGSGTHGIREKDEVKNQQFLIHIVPKIGKILEEE